LHAKEVAEVVVVEMQVMELLLALQSCSVEKSSGSLFHHYRLIFDFMQS